MAYWQYPGYFKMQKKIMKAMYPGVPKSFYPYILDQMYKK